MELAKNNNNNLQDKYTIISTHFTYGQIIETVEKEQVRKECERLKNVFKIFDGVDHYCRIEVVNNETGECREFWNNHENIIQF